MSQQSLIWLVILAALVAANWPFVSQRLFLVKRAPAGGKTLAWRLLELLPAYAVVVGLGRLVEGQVGQVNAQGWQFYAVTGSLFITAAFPGFVYRYLLRRR